MTQTAGDLAQYLGAKIHGDTHAPVSGLANPESAKPEDLIYVDSPRQVARAAESAARCVLASPGTILAGKTTLEIENPKFAFAKAAAWLLTRPQLRPEIHPTAIVSASARLAPNIRVGPYVVIEDGVEIGPGVKIDNLVQIAHNVRIGENSVVAAQVGISGSCTVGARVLVGGQVGIAPHCKLEDDAIIGAQAGIPSGKTIRRGQTVWGTPARPFARFKEQYGWLSRLPELAERVRKLEQTKTGE